MRATAKIQFMLNMVMAVNSGFLKDLQKKLLPNIPVSLSSEVVPEMQEYERTITTVANSYVRPKVAELLINKGANVNALNYEGETPIFGLIKYNNSLDSVKLLIKKHNVLTGKPNNYGSTLLHKLANDPRLNYKLQLTKYLITVGIDKYGPKILHIENKNKVMRSDAANTIVFLR